ncbi:MAG: mechanosensitive ion channel family protein [Ignavibacteriaceae bacterium]
MFTLLNKFREYTQNDLLYQIFIVVAIIIISVFLAKLFSLIVKKLFLPITKKKEFKVADEIIQVTENGVFRLIIVIGLSIALAVFNDALSLTSLITNKTLIESYPFLDEIVIILDYILFFAVVFLLVWISFKLANIGFHWYGVKVNASENKNLSGSLFPLLSKIAKIMITIIAVMIVLAKFKVDISAFVVSLGVGSLAIALAAQETISNMISGFIVMVDRPFRIGDRIKIGTDVVGDVTEIGIRSTKIIDFDNNVIVIPNNDVVKSRIINLSYPDTLTRVLVEVGVAYGSDLNLVKDLMIKAAVSLEKVDKELKPEAYFMSFGDSSLNMRIAVKTRDYRDAFQVGCDLREKIYEVFNSNNITIPFPQRDLHIIPSPGKKEKI